MILFTNLKDVTVNNKKYNPIPVIKLTVKNKFNENNLTQTQRKNIDLLQKEAKTNNFEVRIL